MNESKNAMELRTWTQKSSSDEAEDLHLKRTRLNDDKGLLRLGKKPVLKRNFGFMSILGFSCTVLITWEGILVTSVQSLLNGGPAGVIWGFLIDWIGTTSTFIAIAELASIAPTAAGQYHWVAMMAPARFRGFMSYVTGGCPLDPLDSSDSDISSLGNHCWLASSCSVFRIPPGHFDPRNDCARSCRVHSSALAHITTLLVHSFHLRRGQLDYWKSPGEFRRLYPYIPPLRILWCPDSHGLLGTSFRRNGLFHVPE